MRISDWSSDVCSSDLDAEHVLGALAEGGDARVVHAQAALAQHVRDVGQQARAVGTDQAEYGLPALGAVVELDARDDAEVAQVARLGAPRRVDALERA